VKITNRLGLPMPIVKAVENDPYDNKGTLSVTTLLKPPQAYGLTLRHRSEMEEDAADRIWALVGQVGHTILERAAGTMDPERWVSERRYYGEIDGVVVSGQVDLIDTVEGVVTDFKFTSGWAVIDARSGKSEWQLQLSMLAWLARRGQYKTDSSIIEAPVAIRSGKIMAIVRDWTESMAKRTRDWPEKQVEVIDMNILGDEQTEAWMKARIVEMKDAEAGNWRPCTDEERWYAPGKWAVYKGANQKAAKLEDTEDQLSTWIFANRAKLGADYRIEQRPAVYKRCAKYCAAAPFCQQYQSTKGEDEEE
jgi:hypothetical protein